MQVKDEDIQNKYLT